MIKKSVVIFFCYLLFTGCGSGEKTSSASEEVDNIKALSDELAQGWNTWNTRSVLSHVLLPEGFALNLQLKAGKTGQILKESLIGRHGEDKEVIKAGPHAYDGSYTELEIAWQGINLKIQTATKNNELYMLVTPLCAKATDSLIFTPEMIWENEGAVRIENNLIAVKTTGSEFDLKVLNKACSVNSKTITIGLDKPVALTQHVEADLIEVKTVLAESFEVLRTQKLKYHEASDLYDAMQTVLAWDLIYEPNNHRVIAPVSRIWNCDWGGGWILFDWDTYFAAWMFSLDNKELAYSNALAITKEISNNGFIPNFSAGIGRTEDRSQPPVGSFVIKSIYDKYKEKWFLEETFEELITWNRWWEKNRDIDGYLVWGSDAYVDTIMGVKWLTDGIGTKEAAMWETGLDNSPMWDDAVYDTTIHRMMLADVGLMSFYVLDCQELAKIATILDKPEIATELEQRGEKYKAKLETLWDEKTGFYLNKDLVTGELSPRISPTMFYPLLANIPDQKRAERMINEHFYNPNEFWGDYIIPSISRNDPGYPDNTYWRGRIWAPMNFLVYLGIKNYDLPKAQKDLVDKSSDLLLQSWMDNKYVYENYNGDTGRGDDVKNSDKFYHWGALLSFIKLMEEGYFE